MKSATFPDEHALQLSARTQPLDCRLTNRRQSRSGFQTIELRFDRFSLHKGTMDRNHELLNAPGCREEHSDRAAKRKTPTLIRP
jgi:hypothetical protein